MTVFKKYACYYNLLYRDKDYPGEAHYIHNLIKTYAPHTHSILDLGCGTAQHALLLIKEGYEVHGVDISSEMLQHASEKRSKLPRGLQGKIAFTQGDMRKIRLNQQFDTVISLFHAISYQTTNEDLEAAFATVRTHLKPGGIFIFDCWYGPAVLSIRPSVRVKRLEDEGSVITRIAEPEMYPEENLVDVHYHVFIQSKQDNLVTELQENHRMRYLFKPEIDLLLAPCAMSTVAYLEWMSQQKPGVDTWSVCFIVKG